MKKIIILAIGLFVAGAANAQSPIRLGVKAGLNLPNIIKGDGNNNYSTKVNPGFNAGVTLDINLIKGLAFTPELLYSTKGYKAQTSFGEYTQTTQVAVYQSLAVLPNAIVVPSARGRRDSSTAAICSCLGGSFRGNCRPYSG